MKVLTIFFIFAASVNTQEWEDTVTGLLQAQAELAVGHEFFEMNIIASRDTLSTANYGFMRQILETHMDVYAGMKTIADDTTAALNVMDDNQCISAVRQRWDIQVSRAGQSLSRCIATFNRSKRFFVFVTARNLNNFVQCSMVGMAFSTTSTRPDI
jgi:hypothetical protein